jgi:hypothetical protein
VLETKKYAKIMHRFHKFMEVIYITEGQSSFALTSLQHLLSDCDMQQPICDASVRTCVNIVRFLLVFNNQLALEAIW